MDDRSLIRAGAIFTMAELLDDQPCHEDPFCSTPCQAPEHEWKPERAAAIPCHSGDHKE